MLRDKFIGLATQAGDVINAAKRAFINRLAGAKGLVCSS